MEEVIIVGEINITTLLKAKKTLEEALAEAESDLERDGAIQRFEYTYELAWKTLKRVLKYRGQIANSPREVFRLAAQENLISDPLVWFGFSEKRNNTTHTYNESMADKIFAGIPDFNDELQLVIDKLLSL